jgi:hypothetical protein
VRELCRKEDVNCVVKKISKNPLKKGVRMDHVVKKISRLPKAFAGFTVAPRRKECKSSLKDGVCVAFGLHRI